MEFRRPAVQSQRFLVGSSMFHGSQIRDFIEESHIAFPYGRYRSHGLTHLGAASKLGPYDLRHSATVESLLYLTRLKWLHIL